MALKKQQFGSAPSSRPLASGLSTGGVTSTACQLLRCTELLFRHSNNSITQLAVCDQVLGYLNSLDAVSCVVPTATDEPTDPEDQQKNLDYSDMIGPPKAGQTARSISPEQYGDVGGGEFQFNLKGVSFRPTECILHLKYDKYQIQAYHEHTYSTRRHDITVHVGTAHNTFCSVEYVASPFVHAPDHEELEAFDPISQRDINMAAVYQGPPATLRIPVQGAQSGSILAVKFECEFSPFKIAGIDFHGSLLWPAAPLAVTDFTRNATIYAAYLRNALYIGAPVVARDTFSNIKRNDQGHFVGWFSGNPPMLIWWPEHEVASFVEPAQIALSAVSDGGWLCASCGAENKFKDSSSINTCCECKQSRPLPAELGAKHNGNVTQESIDRLLALFQQQKSKSAASAKLQELTIEM